jgi:hypothetical protein
VDRSRRTELGAARAVNRVNRKVAGHMANLTITIDERLRA